MGQQVLARRSGGATATVLALLAACVASVAGCTGSSLQSVNPVAPSAVTESDQSGAGAGVSPMDATSRDAVSSANDEDSDSDSDSDSDNRDRAATVDFEGVIGTVTGTCPTRVFMVATRIVRTSASTAYRDGACSDLRAGARVKVYGRRAADGSTDATRIEFLRAEPEAEVEGVVAVAISGCPTGSFTVTAGSRNVVVRVSSATQLRGGDCSDLRTSGRRVEVKGRRAADGSIDATRVEIQAEPEAEAAGVVAVAITACPTGTFSVAVGGRNVVVRTSSATQLRGGVCNDLRAPGRRVEVKGRRSADGSIDATRVEIKEIEQSRDAALKGTIDVAASGCPAGSFTLSVDRRKVIVRVTQLTTFRSGACRDLRKRGRRVEIDGRLAADGSMDAVRVKFDR